MDAAHRPPKQSEQFIYLVRTFLFGVISYAVVGLVYAKIGRSFDLLDLTAKQWKFASALDELAWALFAAFILSLLWIAGRTHKIITRALNYFRISNHVADQDIWEFMSNSDTPKIKFAYIRDYKNQLIYSGYVRAYSETEKVRELAMYDVVVYKETGDELYSVPYLYISRDPSSITLEFPVAEVGNDKARRWRFAEWWERTKRRLTSERYAE